MLRTWQPLVVPGLLQTESYARQVFRGANPGRSDADIEQRAAARMARQRIWQRSDPAPPMLAAVIGETVLRRLADSAYVTREQLARLLESS